MRDFTATSAIIIVLLCSYGALAL